MISEAMPPGRDRLQAMARRLLREKKLPLDEPVNETAGSSGGYTCAVCQGAILEPSIDHTVEFLPHEPSCECPRTLHFHTLCHHIWEQERQTLRLE